MRKFLAVATMMALVMAVGVFAQASKGKATTHQASGTISALDAGKLVLKHKVSGKDQETSFTLNAETKKEGDLKVGEKATVHYKVEGGQNIATLVKVTASKK